MALWLGKVDIKEEDLPKFFRERKRLMEFYLNDMKFRVIIRLTSDELEKYEKAIIKKYGSFSALNSREAAKEALTDWIQKMINE